MKKALAGVLAVALVGIIAVSANAQVPFVQVFFDPWYSQTQSNCMPPGTPASLYVVLENWNMFVIGVDFTIMYPPALFWTGDNLPSPSTMAALGNSPTGIAIAWNLPQNGFAPVLALIPQVLWVNCDCQAGPQPLVVHGYAPTAKAAPTAVRWPDYAELPGVGMTSLICPGAIATENKTWGGVKALYR
jgi:hypothetical protein